MTKAQQAKRLLNPPYTCGNCDKTIEEKLSGVLWCPFKNRHMLYDEDICPQFGLDELTTE